MTFVGSENSRLLVSAANVSIFLITLHAPLSTDLKSTLPTASGDPIAIAEERYLRRTGTEIKRFVPVFAFVEATQTVREHQWIRLCVKSFINPLFLRLVSQINSSLEK